MNIIIKNYLKAIGIILILLLSFSLIINSLYYFDIINNDFTKYLKLFLSILSFFIGGIYIGKHSLNKGYINGLKLSIIIIFIFLITGIIFNNLSFLRIIYYLIIAFCITFGSMIGISKKA